MAAAKKKSALSKLGLPGRIAVGFLMLGLPLAGYFTVFQSEIQAEINAEVNTHQQLQQDLKKAEEAEKAYQADMEELAERQRNKRELMKALPADKEAPAFLSSIQAVANLVGIELRAWTPQDEEPDEFYARIPMRLEVRGRYHQIAKFMYNVAQLERIINMEDISLTASQKGKSEEDKALIDVKVLATAFHALEEPVDEGAKGRKRRNR